MGMTPKSSEAFWCGWSPWPSRVQILWEDRIHWKVQLVQLCHPSSRQSPSKGCLLRSKAPRRPACRTHVVHHIRRHCRRTPQSTPPRTGECAWTQSRPGSLWHRSLPTPGHSQWRPHRGSHSPAWAHTLSQRFPHSRSHHGEGLWCLHLLPLCCFQLLWSFHSSSLSAWQHCIVGLLQVHHCRRRRNLRLWLWGNRPLCHLGLLLLVVLGLLKLDLLQLRHAASFRSIQADVLVPQLGVVGCLVAQFLNLLFDIRRKCTGFARQGMCPKRGHIHEAHLAAAAGRPAPVGVRPWRRASAGASWVVTAHARRANIPWISWIRPRLPGPIEFLVLALVPVLCGSGLLLHLGSTGRHGQGWSKREVEGHLLTKLESSGTCPGCRQLQRKRKMRVAVQRDFQDVLNELQTNQLAIRSDLPIPLSQNLSFHSHSSNSKTKMKLLKLFRMVPTAVQLQHVCHALHVLKNLVNLHEWCLCHLQSHWPWKTMKQLKRSFSQRRSNCRRKRSGNLPQASCHTSQSANDQCGTFSEVSSTLHQLTWEPWHFGYSLRWPLTCSDYGSQAAVERLGHQVWKHRQKSGRCPWSEESKQSSLKSEFGRFQNEKPFGGDLSLVHVLHQIVVFVCWWQTQGLPRMWWFPWHQCQSLQNQKHQVEKHVQPSQR